MTVQVYPSKTGVTSGVDDLSNAAIAAAAAAGGAEYSVLSFSDVASAVATGTDCTAAVQAAYAFVVATQGRGTLFFPKGVYKFSGGVASADGYKNGLLLAFTQVNIDPTTKVVLRGEGGTVFQCTANDMVLLRIARNHVTVRDICLDANGKTGVILCGIVPEDMTQTSTLVSQQHVDLYNVDRIGGAGATGLKIQPGPYVGGSDSGCFYFNVYGGVSNFVGGGIHVHLAKNVDWNTHSNRPTRVKFFGQHLLRGNVGYYMEVGSEVELHGCHEELIANDTTPLATPTARYISGNCTNVYFFGGYSEACTKSADPLATGIVWSWGYIPASGSDNNWRAYAASWGDGAANNVRSWTPVVSSSGGGSQGTSASVGYVSKNGKRVDFKAEISVDKGTLGAGTISISGLPYPSNSTWGLHGFMLTNWATLTLTSNVVAIGGYISGSTIIPRKLHAAGASSASLTVAECDQTISFTITGSYEAA